MPWTNLAIQRRRMNEIHDLIIKWAKYEASLEVQPLHSTSHECFIITTERFNEDMIRDLLDMDYRIMYINIHPRWSHHSTEYDRKKLDIGVLKFDHIEKKKVVAVKRT